MISVESLDVVPYPHPALRWKAKPVTSVTPLVQDVARRMISLMHEYKGIGLAANQVAVPWRMFVSCALDGDMVFINPTITPVKGKRLFVADIPEGCLSIQGLNIDFPIHRDLNIEVSALDINGNPFTVPAADLRKNNCLLARCALHETDHLDGILFVDYVPTNSKDEEIQKLRKYVDGWLNYLKTQYEFLPSHGKLALGKYESNDQEIQKLLALEGLMSSVAA